MPTVYVTTLPTPLGPLTVLLADDVIRAAGFTDDADALARHLDPALARATRQQVADLGETSRALDAYFAGDVYALDGLRVEQPGGPFRQRVWAALRALPPGAPATYLALARQLGDARLARAVGTACATNQIAPIVPCHRLIRTSGHLAGYAWGLERKRWLLDHERRHAAGTTRVGSRQ